MDRPIELLCEEERLRRLSERMSNLEGDATELSRQRRARHLVEEMASRGPALRSRSTERRRQSAIGALEAGLEARWRAVLREMEPVVSVPILDCLEGVTVRSVVSLRGLTEVPQEVEKVTVAVLSLTNEVVKTWEDCRRVLLKPGHFVSSLRKFPNLVDQLDGRVVAAARRCVAEVRPKTMEVHEGAQQLLDWLRAALELCPADSYPLSAPESPIAKLPESPKPQDSPKKVPVRRGCATKAGASQVDVSKSDTSAFEKLLDRWFSGLAPCGT